MRILVIGGTYFLGKAFVQIAANDNEIVLLNRGNRKPDFINDNHISYVKADRNNIDNDTIERLTDFGTFDAVVDFCAYKEGDIIDVVSKLNKIIKHYIFVSTSDVYKRGTLSIIDEDAEFETRDFGAEAGSYILGKVALENELKTQCEKYSITYNSIRPVFIYGPGNYANREDVLFNWIEKAGQVIFPENSDGSFQMVYVYDVAKVILKLCEMAFDGNKLSANCSFNITGPDIVTYETLVDALSAATKVSIEKVPMSIEEINERNIPLAFPMTKSESETYTSKNAAVLNMEYISLEEGLKRTYENRLEETLVEKVDEYFDNNDPNGARDYMLSVRERAKSSENKSLELTALNELIGYYRQISAKKELLSVISDSINILDSLNEKSTLRYATICLNIANAYRSLAMHENAEQYYEKTKAVYDKKISDGSLLSNDLRIAGLNNNQSLLFQEKGDFESAKAHLLKALEIVKSRKAEFEIAVTYANLANTCVLAKSFDEAKEYAYTAIRLFKAMALIDPHYCAAISALATCYFEAGNILKASKIFKEAMEIVKEKIGENSQYERLKDSYTKCEEKLEKSMSGMELSKKYYETYGKKMIHERFGEYEDRIAIGLVGEGSDCFMYDDEYSTDHDFGPDFCMFITEDTYEKIGDELTKAYNELPDEINGVKRNTMASGQGRRGVLIIPQFYKKFIGTDDVSKIDYSTVKDYALAACTNGEVFRDDEGIFSEIRNQLKKGYKESIRYMKIAEEAASFSQCAQYNYFRMLDREDESSAQLLLNDGMKHAMKLYHLICNKYAPHDKWLYRSTRELEGGKAIALSIDQILNQFITKTDKRDLKEAIEYLAKTLAEIMYDKNIISDIEPYLDYHTEELLIKAQIADLPDEDIVDKIVRLEFETFDKVKNEGGRASCQNNWPTFNVMRRSQYLTWNRDMLIQYYYDFRRECNLGHNLITEKYGRMMESTDKKAWNDIKDNFPELSDEKRGIIEQIVAIQMKMMEEFSQNHPKVATNARTLHTSEDTLYDTSYETYLRGEISTYSDKMLQLYGKYVVDCFTEGENIALNTMTNTAKIYGFSSLEEFESR